MILGKLAFILKKWLCKNKFHIDLILEYFKKHTNKT